MVGIPVTIASRFVTIINVIPIKTIGMISQISVYPKLLPSIAAVVIAPGPITIPVAINPGPILFIRSFNGSRSTFAPNTSVELPVKYDKYGLTSPVLLLMYVCQDLQILLLPGR